MWSFANLRQHLSEIKKSKVDLLDKLQSSLRSENDQLLAEQKTLIAKNEHLLVEQKDLMAINARLLRDASQNRGLSEYYQREAEWRAAGGTIEGLLPPNYPAALLSHVDMATIVDLARKVPPGGTIVDIGSLVGASTMLWCTHSKASHITSIDPWEDAEWNKWMLAPNAKSIKEKFLLNVTDPRVTPMQGFSPQCAEGWSEPLDLYWEDGDHSNPTCHESIQFWSQHVKPGGIACGHDYHLPDVKAEVDMLASRWGVPVQLGGSVWSLTKPSLG